MFPGIVRGHIQPISSWQDNLFGGNGDDEIYGFEGSDWISGGDGVDQLFGAGGDDRIWTGYGTAYPTDNVDNPLNPGNQLIGFENEGNGDFASGGSGNDQIYGDRNKAFKETLFGGEGHDLLWGYAGDDTLDGGSGDDRIYGGVGNDKIWG